MSTDLILHRQNTFLHVSAKKSKFNQVVKACQSNKRHTPDFVVVKDYSQWTALHWAAAGAGKEAYEACEALLLSGFSTNKKSRDGTTPLMLAKRRGHENIIELLEFHSSERVSMRHTSISKRCYTRSRKDGTIKVKKVKHLVPCDVPDLEPEEGYQTFDQLVAKFKVIMPNFKFPKSKYRP